jgi:hypothetical protein
MADTASAGIDQESAHGNYFFSFMILTKASDRCRSVPDRRRMQTVYAGTRTWDQFIQTGRNGTVSCVLSLRFSCKVATRRALMSEGRKRRHTQKGSS